MNKTAINTLINLLENIPPELKQGFNMHDFKSNLAPGDRSNVDHPCKTVACIAGWTAQHLKRDGSGLLPQAACLGPPGARHRDPGPQHGSGPGVVHPHER